jgi:hypothetical protein
MPVAEDVLVVGAVALITPPLYRLDMIIPYEVMTS